MPNFHGAKSSRRVSANAGETESTAEMGPGIEGGSCFLLYERIRLGAMVSQREVSISAPKLRANLRFCLLVTCRLSLASVVLRCRHVRSARPRSRARLRRLLLRFPLLYLAGVSPFVQITPVLHLPFQPVFFSPSSP